MPQQPDHSRFRPEDLTTCPVSRFRDLDAMTTYVDYLLMRISEQEGRPAGATKLLGHRVELPRRQQAGGGAGRGCSS